MNSNPSEEPAGGVETACCPLCGPGPLKPRHVRADRYAECPQQWTVAACGGCGLQMVSPRPTPEAIGRYYPDTYSWHDVEAEQEGSAPLPERLERAYRHHLLHYEARQMRRLTGRSGGRVLDVGCAAGDRLIILKRMGYAPTGVETSPEAEAAKRLGFDVWHGTVETSHFEPESFEVVTLYNVLEHVHSPAAVLKAIARLLAPGGHLLVQVPNRRSLQARAFGARWAAMDVPRDLYYYDHQALAALMDREGFAPAAFTTRSSFWHPPTAALSLFPGLDPRLIWADRKGGRLSLIKRVLWGLTTLAVAPGVWIEGALGVGASMTTVWTKR